MAGGALPPVLIELKAMTSEFKASMDEAKAELGEVESEGSKHLSGLQSAGKVAAVGLATAFTGAAALSVKSAMEYQSSLATVQGAAGLTTAQVNQIGNTFLDTMGKSTFSAQEMASAFAPVAGVVKQVNGGTLTAGNSMQFMQGAMDLAEASGQNLTTTTQALSQVMLSYGINSKGAGEASNELFNISRNTGVGLDQLASVVDKLHGRLGIAAPSLADTGALMIDLGQHGISGSRGVMVAQTALTTLLGGSKATNAELQTLGVHVFDASGKFIGMQAVLQQLTPKLAGMSDQQRVAAERALFGASAGQAMNSTILAGASALDKARAATEQKDAVDKAAAAQANTLHGQIHMVAATAEDLAVKFGQLLIPVIQTVIRVVATVVGWLDRHKTVAMVLGGVIGGVLVAAIVAWTASLFAADGALAATALTIGGLDIAMGPLILVIGAIIAVALLLATHWKQVWGAIRDVVMAVWNDALKPIFDLWKAEFMFIVNAAEQLWSGIVTVFDGIRDAIMTPINFVIDFVKNNWPMLVGILLGPFGVIAGAIYTYWDQIKGYISDAINAIETVLSDVMGVIQSAWNAIWGAIKSTVQVIWDAIKAYVQVQIDAVETVISTVTGAIKAAWDAVWGAIKTSVSTVWDGIKTVVSDAINGVKSTIGTVMDGLKSAWDSIWGGIKSTVSTVVSGIQSIIGGIKKYAIDPLTSAINEFSGMWSTVWGGVQSAVQTAWDVIKPIIDTIKSAVGGIVGAVKDVGGALGAVGHGVGSALGAIGLDGGGAVPGPVGAPRPAVVHGGEYMLSHEMLTGSQKIDPQVVNAVIANAGTLAGGGGSISGGSGVAPLTTPAPGGAGQAGGGVTVMQPITVNVTGSAGNDPQAIAVQIQQALAAHNAEIVRAIIAAGGR